MNKIDGQTPGIDIDNEPTPLVSSDSEASPEAGREGSGRCSVQPFDGLQASCASVSCAGVRPKGAGSAPKAAAQDEAHAGPNSQPADGLPAAGGSQSEREAEQWAFERFADLYPHEAHASWPARFIAYAKRKTGLSANQIRKLLGETASVKPIAEAQRPAVAGTLPPLVGHSGASK